MATAYSSEPINFKNIISNRSPEEIRENITLLITLFIDQSIDITFIYLSHSEVEVSVDTFLDGMIILLQSFFLDENIEILSGISQGDKVVKGPYIAISKKLKEGSLISESKASKGKSKSKNGSSATVEISL